jgi:hypothetical protein
MADGIRTFDRREFLRLSALVGTAALLQACTGKDSSSNLGPTITQTGPPGTLPAISHGAVAVSMISATVPVNPGRQLFSFALVEADGVTLVTAPTAEVWLGEGSTDQARGPYAATHYKLTAYEETGDKSPNSNLSGIYAGEIDVPDTGKIWTALGMYQADGGRGGGTTTIPVTAKALPAGLGTKAVSTKSPVATTEGGRAQICTREPPCDLHSISIDAAFRTGKPTVICFATPLLCTSKLCAPTLDEVIVTAQQIGDRANFIHIEEFLPGKKLDPPPPSLKTRSPAFKAYGFEDEPWVILVDGKGVVRGRLGPGASATGEITSALQPLLA